MVAAAVVAAGVASAGAAAFSANKQSNAAKKASKEQAKAAEQAAGTESQAIDKAIAFQREQYQQQREDIAPFREIGLQALETLAPGVQPGGEYVRDFTEADFQADPGYQFRIEEGNKALDRSAAARGRLQSGGHLRDLTRFNQGLASEEYGNAFNRFQIEQGNKFNRLGSVAGIGERSTMQLNTLGSQYGRDTAQNLVNQGRARASGYTDAANAYAAGQIGSANAWAQGVNNIGNSASQGLSNYYLYTLATR